ncbi:hypothetical protein [Enterococcus hirae]|uniref:hypothetical protein n=1 Tax=Enterococcus hirae TaxID=1354 RepID=UPI00137095BD|nr:hypothetical protein [Enterococcus hirae]NAE18308.1 hypothetical protein [Enterococcus hirae]
MRKPVLTLAVLGLAAVPVLATGPAFAAGNGTTTTLQAQLSPLNSSGASGTVMATLTGDQLKVTIHSTGLLAGAPHAQHIHLGGTNSCPSPTEKGKGANGALQVSDAADSYGMIAASLTTSGDTSPDSGLAVDRFPVGSATYSRTITLTADQAAQVAAGKGVIVQHGVDLDNDGKYDGSVVSDLNPALPEEATDPANCGVLAVSQMSAMPSGGMATGGGSTSGVQDQGLIVGGVALAAAALGALGLRRRSTRTQA